MYEHMRGYTREHTYTHTRERQHSTTHTHTHIQQHSNKIKINNNYCYHNSNYYSILIQYVRLYTQSYIIVRWGGHTYTHSIAQCNIYKSWYITQPLHMTPYNVNKYHIWYVYSYSIYILYSMYNNNSNNNNKCDAIVYTICVYVHTVRHLC